jgi:hypothetical protein
VAERSIWSDWDAFCRRYIGRIIFGGGSILLSAVIAGLTWFVIEYRNQQLGIETAKQVGSSAQLALDAHTAQEREHYTDLMTVLDELQKSNGAIQVQLGILNCKLGDCGFGAVPLKRHYDGPRAIVAVPGGSSP